jgi:hypothetical protein
VQAVHDSRFAHRAQDLPMRVVLGGRIRMTAEVHPARRSGAHLNRGD